jgi:hypothetical protein
VSMLRPGQSGKRRKVNGFGLHPAGSGVMGEKPDAPFRTIF